jgi:glycosyltransferase involved in cell wall biosynthesis
MANLRIAMISEHASPLADLGGVDAGGQNVHVSRLAAALAQRGHEVRVFTRRDDARLPEVVRTDDGFIVEHVPAGPPVPLPKDELLPYMPGFGDWLARRWKASGAPDVVHAHFWMSGVAALAADPRRTLPTVVTFHALGSVKRRMQGAADTSPPGRMALEQRVARSVTQVIAQCSDELLELRSYGLRRSDLTVVPSGVDVRMFRPDEAGPRRRSAGEPARILTVGRMVPRKGFADLVRALPLLPDGELLIAGGSPAESIEADPLAAELCNLAGELGVGHRMTLLGALGQQQMAELYRSVDVLACTPLYEPFGITPLEAMASGVPVVGYAVGGLQDTIAHDVTGLLVAPGGAGSGAGAAAAASGGAGLGQGGVHGVAAALRRLLDDEPTRQRYAQAALRRARAEYAWERIAGQVENAYRHAIELRSPTNRRASQAMNIRRRLPVSSNEYRTVPASRDADRRRP